MSTTAFAAGFDTGYASAIKKPLADIRSRMSPPEYFWCNALKFDLREATRGEQEAVRVIFLAQKLDPCGFSKRHVELLELVLGHRAIARDAL
jgi:hypothetical protein